MAFVDRVATVRQGGATAARAAAASRREKYVPKGGPDGGDGGDGGDVIVRAVAGTDSLADIVNRKHWRADNGGRGERRQLPRPQGRRPRHPRAAGHARSTTATAATSCAT